MSKLFTGTVAELSQRGVSLNGTKLSKSEISILLKIGEGSYSRKIGSYKPNASGKGKPHTVWEVNTDGAFNFAAGPSDGVSPSVAALAQATASAPTADATAGENSVAA